MLPGESVVHAMRPSPWSFAPVYGAALVHGLLAFGLARLFASPGWPVPEDHRWYQVWDYLRGNAAIAFLLGLAATAGAVALMALALRLKTWLVALDAAGASALLAACVAWLGATSGVVAGVALGAVLHFAVGEGHRLASRILVTDKRVVAQDGWRGPIVQARLADIADIDLRQDPVGRLLRSGTLVFVTQPHAAPTLDDEAPTEPESRRPVAAHAAWPRMRGVHPVPAVRELVEALVQESSGAALQESARKRREALVAALAK